MSNLRTAIIQMNSSSDSPQELAAQLKTRLDELPAGVSLVILPELWTVSRFDETIGAKAASSPAILDMLSGWARNRLCAIHCGSLPWKDGNHVLNRAFFIGENGEQISSYDKAHLIPMMEEDSFFTPGDEPSIFLWKQLVCGNATCYDIRFPEYIRCLSLAGARILMIPAAWPKTRIGHWRIILQARAIENQVFVLACNRSGLSGDIFFGGHSMAVSPDGTIMTEAGEGDETLLFEFDPAEVDRVRKAFPVLKSRRRKLYTLISSI